MRRKLRRWIKRRPWWMWGLLLALAPVLLLNLTVGWLGNSHVFVLSPYHLEDKALAVSRYVLHRPSCLFSGHEPLDGAIAAAARRHRIPPALLAALITIESGSRPHRISHAGAMGPGQLMPGTAALLRVEDPFDPDQAIDGAARYLATQLARYRDVRLALAAYNAGPGSVKGRVPRNGETEFYVARVMAEYARRQPVKRRPPVMGRR